MSAQEEKREQAQKLLRSLTDIDDRYLEEAMEEKPSAVKSGRKIRRYSGWALTAAACLTVVLVGRYVTLRQSADLKNEKSEITSLVQSESLAVDEGMASSAAIQEDAEALEDTAVSKDAEAAGSTSLQMNESAGEDMMAQEEYMDAAEASSTQIANPFADADSLEEAAAIAGFEWNLPEMIKPYTTVIYRAIENEMLEIIFLDEEETEGYRIRKAVGEDDISGDYNEYGEVKTVTLADKTEVTLSGDKDDNWSVAVWTVPGSDGSEAYSYAVLAGEKTFTTKEIKQLAEAMTEQ